MALSTFPVPNKDPRFSFPNRFGIPDAIFNAVVRQCQIQIDERSVSGLWVPAITNINNITSSANVNGFYQRVGDIVSFFALITVTATLAATSTIFTLSLPLPSNFGSPNDAGGSVVEESGAGGFVNADNAADVLFCSYLSGSTSSRTISIIGAYRII